MIPLILSLVLQGDGPAVPALPPSPPPMVIPPDKPITVPVVVPPAPPALSYRTDARGVSWHHADRAWLDTYVDSVNRSYAAPAYAACACAGGSCAVQARPARPFRFFRRGR